MVAARTLVPQWTWPPTVEATLELVGAGKTQTYQILRVLWNVLASLQGRPGRPSAPPPDRETWDAVRDAFIIFISSHPGAICPGDQRFAYSDEFRRFVVGLTAPGQPGERLSTEELARALHLPPGTLKGWLHPTRSRPTEETEPGIGIAPAGPENASLAEEEPGPGEDEPATDDPDPPVSRTIRDVHLRLIAHHWPSWRGTFQGFCQMLRRDHRIPFGNTYIAHFLEGAGLRSRRSRPPVQAPWSHQTFRKLYPGVQWVGDGTSIAVHWQDQCFVFNVEAILDTASNALLGFHVSDTEDEEALLQAYRNAVETAGGHPLSFTLDNRPSNHTPGLHEAVEGIILRATPGRGQAKAALEGAFGLFQQALPPFELTGNSPRAIARSALQLIFLAWARGRNGRPQRRLDGRSPAEAYGAANPTPEEVQGALNYIRELQRREEKARSTREARRDPVRLQLMDEGLEDLGIPDPDRRLAVALAGYAADAIVRGLATFQAKKALGTVPVGADPGRYLGGIIRQLHIEMELTRIADHLLGQRIRLRDITLEPLQRLADRYRAEVHPSLLPETFVDRALEAAPSIDFRFWARAAAAALSSLCPEVARARYHHLCRRIAASYRTDRGRRGILIDGLALAVTQAA